MNRIETKAQYDAAIHRIEELYLETDDQTPIDDPRMMELDMLGREVEKYEDIHYPISKPSLTASNQRWLGERLIEASAATEATANDVRISKHRHGLTDEELAACLAKYVPLTDADFPSLSQEDYTDYLKNHSGRVVKGVEKWLS